MLLSLLGCGSLRKTAAETATDTGDQGSSPERIDSKIEYSRSQDLAEIMEFLASDDLQGRDTGSEGIEQAAAFLEDRLEQYGISPYFNTYRDTLFNSKDTAYNIVGVLEGKNPTLKDEYILIGAHYDHIGTVSGSNGDNIANGANDNASGTTTVLELARIFGGDDSPGRSIIFAFFSAEERGLLGSKHLAGILNEQGLDLYAMINFEMTGVPMKGKDYLMYITGFNRSNFAEVCNAYGGPDLVGFLPTASEYSLFERSDNYAFFKEFGVPSHTFSTFDFENYAFYHQPGDEASLMDYTHMANLVNRVFPVIKSIVNNREREIKTK